MLRCDLCQLDADGLVTLTTDPYGTCFICPECGRRNYIEYLGRDDAGVLLVQQVDRPSSQ